MTWSARAMVILMASRFGQSSQNDERPAKVGEGQHFNSSVASVDKNIGLSPAPCVDP
jgi:hypothetical protein